MGHGKTGVYGNRSSIEDLIGAIKNGETFVTTGPFAGISSSASPSDSIVSNRPVSQDTTAVFIHAISSKEFGPLRTINCFAGIAGNRVEKNILSRTFSDDQFTACEKIDRADLTFKPMYIRAEITCASVDLSSTPSGAFTGAVYFY